jgi:hypothetical protein
MEQQIIHPELPAMHKLLMIALKRLVIPCILERCLPSSFINKVNIITPELVLRDFVIFLNMGKGNGNFWEITASAPYTKKKGISLVAQFEGVRLAHSAHESSSIHLSPSFF